MGAVQQVLGGSAFNGSKVSIGSGSNIWRALPSVASGYVVDISHPSWSTNLTTGVMTYTGASGLFFMMTGIVSFRTNNGGAPAVCEIALDANGAHIGSMIDLTRAVSNTVNGDFFSVLSPTEFVSSFIISPDPGDTFQFICRRLTDTISTLTFSRYQCLITSV